MRGDNALAIAPGRRTKHKGDMNVENTLFAAGLSIEKQLIQVAYHTHISLGIVEEFQANAVGTEFELLAKKTAASYALASEPLQEHPLVQAANEARRVEYQGMKVRTAKALIDAEWEATKKARRVLASLQEQGHTLTYWVAKEMDKIEPVLLAYLGGEEIDPARLTQLEKDIYYFKTWQGMLDGVLGEITRRPIYKKRLTKRQAAKVSRPPAA